MERPADRCLAPVTLSLQASVVTLDGVEPLELDLRYDPRSPYAVTARFTSLGRTVSWTFGRELLTDGLYEPVGSGDVHVRPAVDAAGCGVVVLELRSPGGAAVVSAPAREMHRFAHQVTETVAPGTESDLLDIDAAVRAVLVGAGEPAD